MGAETEVVGKRPFLVIQEGTQQKARALRAQGCGELERLSEDIDPSVDCPLDYYYPLPRGTKGERFPTNDPLKESVLDPRPDDRGQHLHGLLQAIARVEKDGYATLEALGATKLARVDTAGGGAVNPTWTQMRQRMLGVPTGKATNTDAAYGCALLGMQAIMPAISAGASAFTSGDASPSQDGAPSPPSPPPSAQVSLEQKALQSRRGGE